jgi:hypothetical protein
MEIDGNSWKFMRSLWKLMGIHGNFKKICKFNEVFGN